MDLRSYDTNGQNNIGMFCRICGRPTILSSGLCPMCCSDRYGDKLYGATLPELPYSSNVQIAKRGEE